MTIRIEATPDQTLAILGGVLGGAFIATCWAVVWIATGQRNEWRARRAAIRVARAEAMRRHPAGKGL